METLQAEQIQQHLQVQFDRIETVNTLIQADPAAITMLLQDQAVLRYPQPNTRELKRVIEKNLAKTRFYIWNRAFDFKLDPQLILPFNLRQIHQIINQGEVSLDNVKAVAQLATNQFDTTKLLKWALYLFQRSTFESRMKIDTHTWRERAPIQEALIDLMFFAHQQCGRSFDLPAAVTYMREIADTDSYCSPDRGFRMKINHDDIVIDIEDGYLKALQQAQPANYTPLPKKVGIHFDHEPVPEYI